MSSSCVTTFGHRAVEGDSASRRRPCRGHLHPAGTARPRGPRRGRELGPLLGHPSAAERDKAREIVAGSTHRPDRRRRGAFATRATEATAGSPRRALDRVCNLTDSLFVDLPAEAGARTRSGPADAGRRLRGELRRSACGGRSDVEPPARRSHLPRPWSRRPGPSRCGSRCSRPLGPALGAGGRLAGLGLGSHVEPWSRARETGLALVQLTWCAGWGVEVVAAEATPTEPERPLR